MLSIQTQCLTTIKLDPAARSIEGDRVPQWRGSGLLASVCCDFFVSTSDLHMPNKLIRNQNTSTTKAEKLKSKMSEIIISSAPAAFISE